MSQTLNINYDPYAPGTFAIQFKVNGVAPNLSTGYTATMRIWRSGLATTAGADVTATSAGGAISLGTSGAIVLDLVVIHAALAAIFGTTPSIWTYDLIVTPTGQYSQKVCSGQLAEGVGSDQTGDVSAPISVNWAGGVGGDLSGTLPNPTVDGLQGRAVASTAPTNGQVLGWNSSTSQWEPSSAAGGVSDGDKGDVLVASSGATWTVEGIQGRAVQNVAPADGDMLVWSTANSRYEPGQGSHAPNNATYVVRTATGALSHERVLSDGAEVAFDWSTAGFVEPYLVTASITSTHLGAGSVGTTQLQTNSVTLSKLQLPTSSRLLGRGTGSGDFQQLTTTGMVFGAGTVGVEFNNMFAGTGLTGGGKGDADRTISIATSGVTETLIADKAVKYAKIQDIGAASRLLGRGSASGSGAPEEITLGSGLTMTGTTLSSSVESTVTVTEFTYSSSGTYTKPTGLAYIYYEGCGAGGGGGNGSTTVGASGGQGAPAFSGMIHESEITTSTLTITVGTGASNTLGGDSEIQLASGGEKLAIFWGGRAANASGRGRFGGLSSSIFGAAGAASGAGTHGGFGGGGGGGGRNETTGAGSAGGLGNSNKWNSATSLETGGGGAGGADGGGNGTAGTTSAVGWAHGGGGGGANNAGAGGNGGDGGSGGGGGGGGGRGSTAGGNGGAGGAGFIRIIEVKIT